MRSLHIPQQQIVPPWMIDKIKKDDEIRRRQSDERPAVYDHDPRDYRGPDHEPAREVYEISLT